MYNLILKNAIVTIALAVTIIIGFEFGESAQAQGRRKGESHKKWAQRKHREWPAAGHRSGQTARQRDSVRRASQDLQRISQASNSAISSAGRSLGTVARKPGRHSGKRRR
jgi:hypothetical protein